MKVYAVWTGEYSDADVHSIWATKEEAEKVAEFCRRCDRWRGSVHVQDYELGQEAKSGYFFEMYVDGNGKVWYTTIQAVAPDDVAAIQTWGDGFKVDCFADDPESAHKIALDVIAQFKAHKEGIS